MRKKPGDSVVPIKLPAIDGTLFDSRQLDGRRYMISFFRFATCPFCNLRLNELVRRFEELGPDFTVVAVFDSSPENLARNASRHEAPFPILADERNTCYELYGIEHSLGGMLRGMITRSPKMMRGLLKGYVPFPIRGRLTTMPADFLVDERGILRTAYYGRDEGDHLPFDEVRSFCQ